MPPRPLGRPCLLSQPRPPGGRHADATCRRRRSPLALGQRLGPRGFRRGMLANLDEEAVAGDAALGAQIVAERLQHVNRPLVIAAARTVHLQQPAACRSQLEPSLRAPIGLGVGGRVVRNTNINGRCAHSAWAARGLRARGRPL